MSNLNQVLATAQADQITKANAWELFQHATDQAAFNKQLATLNLPDDTKAQLWEMKFGQAVASKPGAFQTKPGGAIRNANEEAATERTNQVAGWDLALGAVPASPGNPLSGQVSVGMLKGLYQTGMTGAEYLSKLLTHLGVHDEEVQNLAKGNVSPLSEAMSRSTNPEQKAGEFGENILEFVAGDEALKGLSLAEKLGMASKLAKLAETSPKWAKALDIGMTSLRQGTVSGAQTLAKGGTPTQAAENAGIVSGVSAGFGAVGAGAGALYRSIAAKSPEAIAAAKEAAEKEGSDLAQRIAGGRLGTAHEVSQNVGEQLADAADKMHADYAQGLSQIGQKAQGVRVPLAGSTLQKTAQDLLSDSTVPAEIQTALKGVVPDAARLNPLLEQFAKGAGD